MSPSKSFQLTTKTKKAFETWCAERDWLNQGAMVDRLLRHVMSLDASELTSLLSPDLTPGQEVTADEAAEVADKLRKAVRKTAKRTRRKQVS